jgi:hypothetical protein
MKSEELKEDLGTRRQGDGASGREGDGARGRVVWMKI